MSQFQLLSVFFALFMMYIVRIHHKKKTLSVTESSMWYSLWTLFIVVAIFPQLLSGLSSTLKFNRVFDFLVVVAFMILSVVTFNNYFSEKKLKQKIENLVRQISLKKIDI